MNKYEKTGYLYNDFKMFHLTDSELRAFNYHYHDFNKVLILISGDVTYHVEGRSFRLQPYDIVLIRAGEVHKPEIHSNAIYERIIIYVSPEFMEKHHEEEQVDLDQCFINAVHKNSNVLRIPSFQKCRLHSICVELEQSLHSGLFANILYQKVLFLEFMIHLNRAAIQNEAHYIETHYSNTKILAVIAYINSHLTTDISIDFLAGHFYISKYHLMHTFKEETGYTIGSYLTTKRLLYARSLIENGMPVTEACYQSGYKNYSTFYRAYKKLFQQSARESLS